MDPAPITHLFLVTGTTRGLGKALVASASDHPNSFVVSLARAAPFLESKRQNIRIDLNDADAIGPAFASIRLDPQRISRLIHTVLINNAGVLDPIAPIGDCDDTLLARNIQVNLTAPLILSRHFFHFCKSLPGRKWIINITSGASRSPYYGWSAYGAAKAGLDMATRAMAMEFTRIDPAFSACAVAPGTIDTAMQEKIRACSTQQFEKVEKFLGLKASGALNSPEYVASTLIRLLLDGRFTNGGRYDLREME
jgi:benzil reductase ((S)-benzoin forming)